MKKIVLLLILLGALKTNAQKFTAGLQINYLRLEVIGSQDVTNSGYQPVYEKTDLKTGGINLNGTFGYNPMFYKFNDDLSFGASANIGIGYFFAPKLEGLDKTYILDFPEYVTIRYGQHASKNTKKKVGFAFGAGYDYTLNRMPYRGVSLMAEICFKRFAIRFNSNITKFTYYAYYTSEGAKPAYTVLPMGIQLVLEY